MCFNSLVSGQQHGFLEPLVEHGVRDVEMAGAVTSCSTVIRCVASIDIVNQNPEGSFQTLLYPDLPQSFSQSCPFLLYRPEWWI